MGLQRKSALHSGARFGLVVLTILTATVTGFCLYATVAHVGAEFSDRRTLIAKSRFSADRDHVDSSGGGCRRLRRQIGHARHAPGSVAMLAP